MSDVVIIGAGQAGFQVAASLRMKKFDGSITLIGAETHPPYQRPPLSKAALKDGLEEAALWFRPQAFYQAQSIDLQCDVSALSIDPQAKTVRLSDGRDLAYGALVLATGARPRTLAASLGVPADKLFELRGLDDAHRLRPHLQQGAKVAIIGAGYIGLEVAASARQLGAEVTVLDLAARVLQRSASPLVSRFFEQLHASRGVELRMNTGVEAVGGTTGTPVLQCSSGADIAFDLLVAGIGVIPNQDLALAAGLAVDDGILTDLHGRTSQSDVYAAGDCARHAHTGFADPVRFESVPSAIDQGKVVADAILGGTSTHSAVPWFWSDQYDAKLQAVGVSHEGCTAFVKGDPASSSFAIYHRQGDELVAVEAISAPQDFVIARKCVGTGRPLDDETLAQLEPAPVLG